MELFSRNDFQSRNFIENIRQYNSAMAFASFGAKLANHSGYGPYCFKIHGSIYHQTGSLQPPAGQAPSYSQLYIIEGDKAVECRLKNNTNQNCLRNTMELLTETLNRVNPYAFAYRRMKDVYAQTCSEAALSNTLLPQVTMYIRRGNDSRRYKEPMHDEVAAIFVGENGEPPHDRDIAIYPENSPPRNMPYTSPNADPMVYPILFPYGDLGWAPGLKHQSEHSTKKRNTVSLLQFYSYKLAAKSVFNPIFYAGKLFQQNILNPNSICMIDGKCSKEYPKPFQEQTILARNGYPHYKRPDNGVTLTVGQFEIDNRWIVPYNPYLS